MMQQLQQAMERERAEQKRLEIIEKNKLRERAAAGAGAAPGPGSYSVPSTLRRDGGYSMGEGNPKSDLDWALLRAKQVPGPGQYTDLQFKAQSPAAHMGKVRAAGTGLYSSAPNTQCRTGRRAVRPGTGHQAELVRAGAGGLPQFLALHAGHALLLDGGAQPEERPRLGHSARQRDAGTRQLRRHSAPGGGDAAGKGLAAAAVQVRRP